jgi:hypothetical protein
MPRNRLVSALWMTGASSPSKLRSTAIATVDVVVHDERALAHRRIEMWELVQRVAQCTHDEWQVGEAEPFALLPRLTLRPPHPLDPYEIDLDRREYVR